ncbi:MAG: MoxR family ATPase [Candidatus Eremiobacteraeota bacterium]|nr:MoxR family ATPase [Candidatus Eremiobacteraeota bacterium]
MAASVQRIAQHIQSGISEVIVGAERMTFALLLSLFAQGHVLIEGVPGTGKTLYVRTLAMLLGLEFRRIQFTPDLMPSDILGTTIFNPKDGEFVTRPGPIVANLILADEINRTPPKTQSALLEAMEEHRATLDGVTTALPEPFMVCATQNPIEYEGTYPLPEAQLDRFMIKCSSQYPKEEQELELLARATRGFEARTLEQDGLAQVTSAAEVREAQTTIRSTHLSAAVQRYIYEIVSATRGHRRLALGASPRAALALLRCTQVAAALQGRNFATPDDVKDTADLVLSHRLILVPEAEIEAVTAGDVLREVLESVPVPQEPRAVTV